MTLPLDGVRVLDLTRLLPGAVCTMLLGELGAEIVKIEPPEGDYARWMPPLLDGLGAFFRATNAGKQSVALNLKHADGQAALARLARAADVVIEGFRPGVMDRLNGDWAALSAANPRLIYCSLSGWGQDGPYAQVSGHDLNYAALGGLLGAMGTPQPLGGQVADVGGAYAALAGILAALFQRERTGAGAYIDAALCEGGMPFVFQAWVEALLLGSPGGAGSLTGGLACYNVYRAGDGAPVALAALEPKFWANFCAAVQRPDLLPDHLQPQRQPYLAAELAQLFAQRPADEWQARLGSADCCFTLVTPLAALAADPQVQARGTLRRDPDGVPRLRSPLRLGDPPAPGPVPALGQHTRAALLAAGYSEGEVDALLAAGAAVTAAAE